MRQAAVEQISVPGMKQADRAIHRYFDAPAHHDPRLFALMAQKLRSGIRAGLIGFMQHLKRVMCGTAQLAQGYAALMAR